MSETLQDKPMTHRQIMEALTGLLAALFTTFLSITIVANALPTIIGDLEASQTAYTWVITAALLANAVSTPLWGKLSDLYSKKALTQLTLLVFVVGSIICAAAPSAGVLIAARVIQGIGIGGLTALAQAVIGSMISPRERGRYAGFMGAVMAVATISGPLLGGVIVDQVSWRWTFLVCVPLAIIALILIQKTLHLPAAPKKEVHLDFAGAIFIALFTSTLLVWVSFGGNQFAWISPLSFVLAGAAVIFLALLVLSARRAKDPIISARLLGNRTTLLAVAASLAVGVALFGGNVFLGQYFQIARGESPTQAGLLTLPLVIASLIASTLIGFLVSKTGRVKPFLIAGAVLLSAGLLGLGSISHTTPLWHLSVFMVLLGAGTGMLLQNLVLVVQNSVALSDIGSASSSVAFFRTLGGTIGVSILGAILASRVATLLSPDLGSGGGRGSLDIAGLPPEVQTLVQNAYGDASGLVFLVAGAISLITLVCVLFIKEVPLRQTLDKEDAPSISDTGSIPIVSKKKDAAATSKLTDPSPVSNTQK